MDSGPSTTGRFAAIREFMAGIPFNRELGLRVVELDHGRAVLEIPFREGLVGDPVRPALHGGVLSSLMDTAGGAAVWTVIGEEDRCSTIDLRVDYLRPGRLSLLRATAEVKRMGNRVGVTSIVATHPEIDDEVVAEAKGVYAVKRAGRSRGAEE